LRWRAVDLTSELADSTDYQQWGILAAMVQ
jgi:hypothetical protein